MLIRPVRRGDAARLREFFAALSADSRRARFLKRADEPTEALVNAFSDVDQARHVAFVCEEDGRVVGDARYTVNAGGRSCEFGIVVADGHRGRGVAQRLMQTLIETARGRGLERMKGLVLSSNARMLRFAQSLGFELEAVPDDPSMLRITKRLTIDEEATRSR